MFTNIESLLRPSLLQKYSFVLILGSILAIGTDIVSVMVYCMNENFTPDLQISEHFLQFVSINGQGIWCGIFGITVAYICNVLVILKNKLEIAFDQSVIDLTSQKIVNLEALLFMWTILVSLVSFSGVLMTGYSGLEILARFDRAYLSKMEELILLTIFTETLVILGLCLTAFTLAIFSFNVLLPIYYGSFAKDLCSGKIFANFRKCEISKWKESPNCEFSHHSFSGSSVQFGTIETLSERSISALTRKLTVKRAQDNASIRSQLQLPQSALPSTSNRNDLIIL